MNIVNCDKCNKNFEIKIEKRYHLKLEIQSFKCPYCSKKYIFAIIDNYVREQRKKLNDLNLQFNKNIRKTNKSYQINKLIEKQKEIIKNMKKHSDMLIEKLGDDIFYDEK